MNLSGHLITKSKHFGPRRVQPVTSQSPSSHVTLQYTQEHSSGTLQVQIGAIICRYYVIRSIACVADSRLLGCRLRNNLEGSQSSSCARVTVTLRLTHSRSQSLRVELPWLLMIISVAHDLILVCWWNFCLFVVMHPLWRVSELEICVHYIGKEICGVFQGKLWYWALGRAVLR
jgi:hypothetical protein